MVRKSCLSTEYGNVDDNVGTRCVHVVSIFYSVEKSNLNSYYSLIAINLTILFQYPH